MPDITSTTPNPLETTVAIDLARELSDQQIEIIRKKPDFGGKEIADRLKMLRDAVWGDKETKKPLAEDEQKARFTAAIEGLNEPQKEQLLSSYAKMGHLYEIASLSARSNYFNKIKANPSDAIPDSIADLATTYRNVRELVEKLNHPVFEVVMTAHPTNVNSLESMQAQREINKALEKHDQEDLTKALTNYQKTSLLKEKKGKEGKKEVQNQTVRDETRTSLYFLGNIYEDLPRVYGNYDSALEKQATKTSSTYDPTSLNLKIKLGSWGSSGDKDGNDKVTAETTLEAIALHTQAILTHYSKDLAGMPNLAKWQGKFDGALTKLEPLVKEIAVLREDAQANNGNAANLNNRFDKLSEKLAVIRNSLDGKNFEKDLNESAKNNTQEGKDSLNLLRRFRTFGFNFSKIEYRETAKEYSRVVGELVDGYKDLKPEQKIEKLTKLLQKSGAAAEILTKHEKEIINDGAGRVYSKDSAKPIAYHTLKRMALARDFGNMIKDNVLAECGQLDKPLVFPDFYTEKQKEDATNNAITEQGLTNILEAQFLQQAVIKDGKHPKLGIVPLFEEPDTLRNIEKIMKAAYDNAAYKKHLEAIKDNSKDKTTQQVQIAHSDNARRSGLQAARAYIHTAHHKMRELEKTHPEIQTQFFEGGSISDAYRNGVRALSKTIDAFALHDFAKFTFQGGDLLNFFNHPSSIERVFDNAISHQTRKLEKSEFEKTQQENGKKWVTKVVNSEGDSPDPNMEINVNKALKHTLREYQKEDFTAGAMGVLLAALGYDKVISDSNAGSRAPTRDKNENQLEFKSGSTDVGGAAVHTGIKLTPIPIGKVRTIGFSKTWQGAGLVPSWVGSLNLKKYMDEEFKFTRMTAENLNKIYAGSPTFHDAQDRSAFAIALTDVDSAKEIAGKKLGLTTTSADDRESGTSYLKRIEDTYKAAAELAYSAVKGESLHTSNLSNKQIRDKMVEALPHLKEDIINKTNYRAALLHWQIEHPELFESQYMGRTAQVAKDTVEHGRWLGASDPSTTKHQKDNIAGRTR